MKPETAIAKNRPGSRFAPTALPDGRRVACFGMSQSGLAEVSSKLGGNLMGMVLTAR
jgi:hypothetical protein